MSDEPRMGCSHPHGHHADEAEHERCLSGEIGAGLHLQSERTRTLRWMKASFEDPSYRGGRLSLQQRGEGGALEADIQIHLVPPGRPDSKHITLKVWEIRRSTAYRPAGPWKVTYLPEDYVDRPLITEHASFEHALHAAMVDAVVDLSLAIDASLEGGS